MADDAERPRGLRAARALVVNTVKDAADDRIVGVSAEVAFFALLALPPGLLVLASVVGSVAGWFGTEVRDALVDTTVDGLGGFLSPDTEEGFVRPAVDGIFGGDGRGGLLSIGLVIALWSASRLIKVMIEAINIAYDVDEWRSAWKRRLLAVGLMAGGVLGVTLYIPFVLAGPRLGAAIDGWLGIDGVFAAAWSMLYWPIAAALGIALLTTLYHVAPNWHTPWRRDVPGAVLAAVIWVSAAFALRVYVGVSVDSTFGPLAAPIVLLLWLYVSAFAVLLGAELNAEIEKLWPTPESHPKVTRFATAAWSRARERLARRRGEPGEPAQYGEER